MYNNKCRNKTKGDIHTMKTYKIKEEQGLIYEQALRRYNVMYRKLTHLKEKYQHLQKPYDLYLETLEELKETKVELEQGNPVWNVEAEAFIEDINNLWDEFHAE